MFPQNPSSCLKFNDISFLNFENALLLPKQRTAGPLNFWRKLNYLNSKLLNYYLLLYFNLCNTLIVNKYCG